MIKVSSKFKVENPRLKYRGSKRTSIKVFSTLDKSFERLDIFPDLVYNLDDGKKCVMDTDNACFVGANASRNAVISSQKESNWS